MAWSGVLVTGGAFVQRPAQQDGVTVAGVADPVEFGDAVAATGAGFVVLLVPAALDEASRAAITLTAFRWPELRLARLVSDHAPLALHVALTLARSAVTEPGLVPGFVEGFLAQCWSGAWTHSVTNLPHPPPSLGQYLRSFLPGSSFLVSCAPEPMIGTPGQLIGFSRPDLQRTLLTTEPGLPASASARLARDSGASAARPYQLPGEWEAVFGTSRVTQLAIVPNDPLSVRVPVTGGCTCCGQLVASPVCGYCRVQAQPLVPVGSAHRADVDPGGLR